MTLAEILPKVIEATDLIIKFTTQHQGRLTDDNKKTCDRLVRGLASMPTEIDVCHSGDVTAVPVVLSAYHTDIKNIIALCNSDTTFREAGVPLLDSLGALVGIIGQTDSVD